MRLNCRAPLRKSNDFARKQSMVPQLELLEARLTPAAPSVLSINRLTTSPFTNSSSIDYAVTFSQPVTGVDEADFQVVKTGTIVTNPLQLTGSGTAYNVTVGG